MHSPTKRCNRCLKSLPATIEYFHVAQVNTDGLCTLCKTCRNAHGRNRYLVPEERVKRREHYRQRRATYTDVVHDSSNIKQCSTCQQSFPATPEYFNRNTQCKDGLYPHCKECRSKQRREQYKNSPELQAQARQRIKDWQIANPERYRDSRQDYYQTHAKDAIDRTRNWRKANPERYLERNRATNRHWRERNPEHSRALVRNYQARKRNAEGAYSAKDILQLYEQQDGKCCYCGVSLVNGYHVDHIIPLSRGGSNFPDNLALACPFCNDSKGNRLLEEWTGPLVPPN